MAQDSHDPGLDAAFAQQALSALPGVPVPPGLEARILADFDAIALRRRRTLWNAPGRLVRGWRDAVWPGAPVWKPAAVLGLSLAIGLLAGAAVPASDFVQKNQTQATSLDNSSFEMTSVMDISGDL